MKRTRTSLSSQASPSLPTAAIRFEKQRSSGSACYGVEGETSRASAATFRRRLTNEGHGMSHQIAKLLLEHAQTFLDRTEAIKSALSLGMPLNEIEEYLDWLDAMRATGGATAGGDPPDQSDKKSE